MVLVEIGPSGRRGEPTVVAIPATPMVDVLVSDPAITPDALRSQVPDAERSLVRLAIEPAAAVESGDAIDRAIRDSFGRVAEVNWRPAPVANVPSDRMISAQADFRTNVLNYVGDHVQAADPHRDELLRLAEGYLDQEARS